MAESLVMQVFGRHRATKAAVLQTKSPFGGTSVALFMSVMLLALSRSFGRTAQVYPVRAAARIHQMEGMATARRMDL